MRTVESVAGDDDVSARAFCRLAEWLSCSTLDNDRASYIMQFFVSLPLESWRGSGIVLQVAEEEFHSRLSIFILKKHDLEHDYSQQDAP